LAGSGRGRPSDGQFKPEDAAAGFGIGHANGATMSLYRESTEGQAEADRVVAATVARCHGAELLEDALAVFWRDAVALVADGDADTRFVTADSNFQGSAIGGVLDAIAHQVHQNPAHDAGINRASDGAFGLYMDGTAGVGAGEFIAHFAGECMQIAGRTLQGDAAVFKPAD
jgi:hypothetical protein